MFYCLHASKEGFLNGCRPFIATGRDGNNNIYPIAFGVVDKEDGDSWRWFLTQLRCCIGSGSKFGTYTIISDTQKENRAIFNGSSSATQVPPERAHQDQSSHIPASSAPPLGPNTMRKKKTSAPTATASTVSTAAPRAPARASRGGFNAPRTSTGAIVILSDKRKRKPTSRFEAYFNASGNH